MVHCLDALRQDVICAANDDLLYIREDHSYPIGHGHMRRCKDFSKLEEWIIEHDACYTFGKISPPYYERQRWTHCAQNSSYLPKMRAELGLDDDWEPDEDIDRAPSFPNW